jgi:hypothetical protein
LNEKLAPRINRVLGSVRTAPPCERFNWQLTPMATLFFRSMMKVARVIHPVVAIDWELVAKNSESEFVAGNAQCGARGWESLNRTQLPSRILPQLC